MSKKVVVGYEKFKKFVEKFGDKKQRKMMGRIGDNMRTSTILKIAHGKYKKLSQLTTDNRAAGDGSQPLKASGALMGSIEYVITGDTTVAVGSGLPYAETVHDGKEEIKPVKAKKLAIPVGRKIAVMSSQIGVRATLEKLSKEMNIYFTDYGIYGSVKGKSTKLFIRADKVTIPPRPFLYISKQDEEIIAKVVEMWYGMI